MHLPDPKKYRLRKNLLKNKARYDSVETQSRRSKSIDYKLKLGSHRYNSDKLQMQSLRPSIGVSRAKAFLDTSIQSSSSVKPGEESIPEPKGLIKGAPDETPTIFSSNFDKSIHKDID